MQLSSFLIDVLVPACLPAAARERRIATCGASASSPRPGFENQPMAESIDLALFR
jgi:hypothetical protein